MNHLKTILLSRLIAMILLILIAHHAIAQESVLAVSGNATGLDGTVSYSVGQVAYHSLQTTEGILTEGVQQPYEILFMTGIPDKAIPFKCVVYPNPAGSYVMLDIETPALENFSYRLSNSSGLMLREAKIDGRETTVPLADLAAGIYMITLMKENSGQVTWKIIKK